MTDYFPKLKVPYEREDKGAYTIATDEVKDDFNWVFDRADEVVAVEKVDGENIRVDFNEDGEPVAIYRRNDFHYEDGERVYDLEEISLWDEHESHYTEGIANAFGQGWTDHIPDERTSEFGELVGPKVQGNRYDLNKHYWVPFSYAHNRLEVESYGEYPTDYDTISDWFDGMLPPLFYSKMHGGMPFDEARKNANVEGLVFVLQTDDPLHEQPMAKLRRSDFPWYYE